MPIDLLTGAGTNPISPQTLGLRLPATAMYRACDATRLPDLNGAEWSGLNTLGRQRALEALEFGIGIQRHGYNIFMSGPTGSGRHAFALERLRRAALTSPTPPDWCYVHNFANPRCPRVLNLPSGRGVLLRTAMHRLIEELLAALPSAFEHDEYRGRRDAFEEQLKQNHDTAFGELAKKAEQKNIALVRNPVGFTLLPMHKGEPIRADHLQRMPEAERNRIQSDLNLLQADLEHIAKQLLEWERTHREQLRELIRETAARVIDNLLEETRADFQDLPAVLEYFDGIEQDIYAHVDEFLALGKQRSEQTMPGKLETDDGAFTMFRRYRVNVAVHHPQQSGAPVVYEDHPTYKRLLGHIEHIAQQGTLLTDFNLIVPGALHRANGGYLILDAERVLTNSFSWDALKRALRAEQIRLESVEELLSIGSTISLEPEAIPLQVTVVLIGSPLVYFLLAEWDADVNALFKIAAELEPDVARTLDSECEYAQLLGAIASRDKLLPVTKAAAARVIEFAARLAGDAQRLSTNVGTVADLLQEANFCAAQAARAAIDSTDVQAAIDARIRRADRLPQRLQEEIAQQTLRIETRGSAVGQINGLAIMTLGTIHFGQPSRITARARLGRGEIIDIERQVHLGGPLHTKGVMILTGFVGERFGRSSRLSLAASLVFEQSYGEVDGDSASAAELFALLSAIAAVPLRQSLAVTGSVDQRGQIQAIGGVNEKIEGFFDSCRTQGFSGEQGVIIPLANARQLMLRSDVAAAVQAGQFNIYAIDHIDEGLPLLSGLAAGVSDANGNYPADSFNYRVAQQLALFAERVIDRDADMFAKQQSSI